MRLVNDGRRIVRTFRCGMYCIILSAVAPSVSLLLFRTSYKSLSLHADDSCCAERGLGQQYLVFFFRGGSLSSLLLVFNYCTIFVKSRSHIVSFLSPVCFSSNQMSTAPLPRESQSPCHLAGVNDIDCWTAAIVMGVLVFELEASPL